MVNFENFTSGPRCKEYELWLYGKEVDIGGGTITKEEIDILKEYPHIKTIAISGLHQDTFDYFVEKYGNQFSAIAFFKNKMVSDLSALGELQNIEYIYYFFNQRVTKLWNMEKNVSLKGLGINDFSRLHVFDNIETAPNLEYFYFGNAVWIKAVIDNFKALAASRCRHVDFFCKKILDDNLSYFTQMPNLERLDFPSNVFTTEQIAWLVANCPNVKGHCMSAVYDMDLTDEVQICGKGKRILKAGKDDEKIKRYIEQFDELVRNYKGMSYEAAFLNGR